MEIAPATTLLAAALIPMLSPPAPAQEVRVGVVRAWPDHELLGSPRGVRLVDGYSPFEDAVGFQWLQLGVSLVP